MRRILPIAFVASLCAFAGDHLTPAVAQPSTTEYVMTPIDTVPSKDQIVALYGTTAVANLKALINGGGDFGIQLRAIGALPRFCAASCATGEPHDSIVALIAGIDPGDHRGITLLRLRAGIEALGATRSRLTSDVNRLVPFLNNASRDVRVATARALRDLCNTQAIVPLHVRYEQEMVAQVRLAISAALRDLGQCSS
ncbi:MAG: hypothetical protein WKG01_35615 [Kofleriaceae bacterium]